MIFMKTDLIPEWQMEQKICSYDVDPQATVRLPALCRFMQEAAYHHAEHLGLGRGFLAERGMAWVLARQRIVVDRWLQWGDSIHIRTWPSGRDRLFFYRDFELTDSAGGCVLCASNAWSLIDVEKRVRVHPQVYLDVEIPEGKQIFGRKLSRLKGSPGGEESCANVNYGDLDLNGHVNNVRYLEWILDSLPRRFHETHTLKELESNFLAEALYGQTVSVCSSATESGNSEHSVRAGDTDLFRAQTTWIQNGE